MIPSYPLSLIKALIRRGAFHITTQALDDAALLDLEQDDKLQVVGRELAASAVVISFKE